MSRRNRERIARIEAGLEKTISEEALEKAKRVLSSSPIARKAATFTSRGAVIKELSRGSVDDQTGRLSELVGTGNLPGGRLKSAIVSNAPKEMDKAIKKLQKAGRAVTVESLCAEAKSSPGFVKMCELVGIEMSFFEDLARSRMEKFGL